MAWEVVARSGIVNAVLFPPPSVVAVAVLEWVRSGQFFLDLGASLYRVVTGFVVGAALGIALGVLTGQFALVSSLLSPLFHILRPIPPIAFVPIVILWFGLSETGKLFLVVWGVFFTVWLSTHIGVQKVDRGLIRAAQMLGTPRRQMLQEIVLLGALPTSWSGFEPRSASRSTRWWRPNWPAPFPASSTGSRSRSRICRPAR